MRKLIALLIFSMFSPLPGLADVADPPGSQPANTGELNDPPCQVVDDSGRNTDGGRDGTNISSGSTGGTAVDAR